MKHRHDIQIIEIINGMVWYGNNLFDITEIHNTLL